MTFIHIDTDAMLAIIPVSTFTTADFYLDLHMYRISAVAKIETGIIISTVVKVETSIIPSMAASPICRFAILGTMYVKTFTTHIIVFIDNVIICLR